MSENGAVSVIPDVEVSKPEREKSEKIIQIWRKPLDVNRYVTKKTIGQGMLDIALLTANASQLKYILQAGRAHEFYSLMLGFIITSLVLQVFQASAVVLLGAAYNIKKTHHQRRADIINDIILVSNILIVVINVIISTFNIKDMNEKVITTVNGSIYSNIPAS